MMKTIYKYPIEIMDSQIVTMPIGSHALSVQMQDNQLCIWVLLETSLVSWNRQVRIFGTGNPINLKDRWEFLGTVQDDYYVWHVFIEDEE